MFIVDRIENGIVIVEYGDISFDVPLSVFKEPISEGDILYFVVDKEGTSNRKAKIEKKLNNLFNRAK